MRYIFFVVLDLKSNFVIMLISLHISISFIVDINRIKVSYLSFVKSVTDSGSPTLFCVMPFISPFPPPLFSMNRENCASKCQ